MKVNFFFLVGEHKGIALMLCIRFTSTRIDIVNTVIFRGCCTLANHDFKKMKDPSTNALVTTYKNFDFFFHLSSEMTSEYFFCAAIVCESVR